MSFYFVFLTSQVSRQHPTLQYCQLRHSFNVGDESHHSLLHTHTKPTCWNCTFSL